MCSSFSPSSHQPTSAHLDGHAWSCRLYLRLCLSCSCPGRPDQKGTGKDKQKETQSLSLKSAADLAFFSDIPTASATLTVRDPEPDYPVAFAGTQHLQIGPLQYYAQY